MVAWTLSSLALDKGHLSHSQEALEQLPGRNHEKESEAVLAQWVVGRASATSQRLPATMV